MSYIDDDVINKVTGSVDIVEVIGEYLPLTQKGKNYFCVCPFHDDHSPSMSVSPEKQIYRCFTCGASGNVITFIMDYENVSFVEALNILGKKCGITVENKQKKKSPYEEYYDIYKLSTNYYKNNLNSTLGESARKYLEKRNLTKGIINEFDIGLSLNKGLTDILLKKTTEQTLIELGLSSKTNGRINDIFKNRIMFPIKDINGNVVAFSGRIFDKSSEAKYVNSKETIIFKKGNVLYNYHQAKEYIRKKKEVILCEGFMEIIRLWSVGIKNAIALMGTSFTKEQLELIKNLKVNVVLNLDNDSAGRLAAFNIGKELESEGINPTVIVFNSHKDTDELISELGREAFDKAYDSRLSFIDYKLNYLKENKDLSDSVELSKYINEAIENINSLNDNILKDIKVKELCKNYNLSEEVIKSKIKKNEDIKVKVTKPILKKKYDKYDKSEIRIIYLMLNNTEVIEMYETEMGYLVNNDRKMLANEIVYYYIKHKEFVLADFINYICDKEKLMEILKEVISSTEAEEYTEDELEKMFDLLKQKRVNEQIAKLKERIRDSYDLEEKKKILSKIEKIKKEVLKW